ncbi:MAG: cation:proton antiporter [Pirellulaceae bacterium]
MEELLLLISLVVFCFALFSSRFASSLVTPPMIFTAVGVLISFAFSGLLERLQSREVLEIVAELTLVIVLFVDASRIRLPLLRRQYKIPARLLGIGLPLTVLLGAVIAKIVFPEFSIWEAALIAAILAPTDAALGQAVVSSPKVPLRIRQSLNVESGLNDGIVLPLVMLFAALAAMTAEGGDQQNWLGYWIGQVTLGPLTGVVVGFGGGYLLQQSRKAGWIDENFQRLSGVALAVIAWAGALQIGGNGFIAAFVAGMCISCFTECIGPAMRDFGEAEGQLLSLTTFMLFGMTLVVPAVTDASVMCFVYAILSLTLIRMLPVAVSLLGSNLRWPSYWFLGWFGPRGLASLLFALLVVGEFEIAVSDSIMSIAVITVLLSMIAHGLTAIPGADLYSRQIQADQQAAEHQPCESHRDKFQMSPE